MKKLKKLNSVIPIIILVLIVITIIFISCDCSPVEPETETGTMKDIDGNVYETIKIGNQRWMAENLKTRHYRNGEIIPRITDNEDWSNLTTGALCDYKNDPDNVPVYGYLYNWYAVSDTNNIAPVGWHVPTSQEYESLAFHLGGEDIAGGKMKETGTRHWKSPNTGATNESGFTALPGGYRTINGNYGALGYDAYFWTKTQDTQLPYRSVVWALDYESKEIFFCIFQQEEGFSVRLIKD